MEQIHTLLHVGRRGEEEGKRPTNERLSSRERSTRGNGGGGTESER